MSSCGPTPSARHPYAPRRIGNTGNILPYNVCVLTTLLVLAAIGGGVLYARRRSRASAARDRLTLPHLPAKERGASQLRTHDVVCHLGRDWLVEGVIQLEDGGRRRRLARLV